MRYIVGIDLGTTNCSVAFVDTEKPPLSVEQFRIPQLSADKQTVERDSLPSFCYLEAEALVIGEYAKHQSGLIPTRVVDSAKSWLCLGLAHRKENILPLIAEHESRKISPMAATTAYLAHIRDAWNRKMSKSDPEKELEQQHIILTVPASFDEVARELTFEAAKEAGFLHVTLLEEPQAAFYHWLSGHEENWRETFHPGETILVCDVGGGTTDFSLIQATDEGFRRMAVGNHLLLGGDNMDHAVAHYLESKISAELTNSQWQQLRAEARSLKEKILGEKVLGQISICLQGSGSSVIGGSLSCTADTKEVAALLMEGFWRFEPFKQAGQIKKQSGFRSFGLPYEEEPSIIKHCAHFLQQHGAAQPHYILFNGGTMTPAIFQQALVQACRKWFPETKLQVLKNAQLDLAVARGAAYYGKVRFGEGIKIAGGVCRAYFIEVDEGEEKKAMTLLPRDAEEGTVFDLGRTFYVTPNTPVSFRMYSSHVRLHDQQGDIVEVNEEEFHLLPPIVTVIRYGKTKEKIPVHVFIQLSEIGTLQIWLQSQQSDHKWKLEFQLQSATGHEAVSKGEASVPDELVDQDLLSQAEAIIGSAYSQSIKPKEIYPKLEALVGKPRDEWGPFLLRGLWPSLIQLSEKRKLSQEHEMRWWNLAGYLLRPGFGVALDDHRIKELWKIILADYKNKTSVHQWICFRRVAGGLNKGQQRQIAQELLKQLLVSGKIQLKSKKDQYPYSEKIRALAALEYLDPGTKIKLGNALLQRIASGKALESDYWALGRIGARRLLYGTVVDVVSKETCGRWVQSLIDSKQTNPEFLPFLLRQLVHETDCREVNLDSSLASQVRERYPDCDFSSTEFNAQDRDKIFGDHLPSGLSLT